MKTHHSQSGSSGQAGSKVPGGRSFTCPICSKVFTKKLLLKDHMRQHLTQVGVHGSGSRFKCMSLSDCFVLIFQNNMHTCDVCGEMFSHTRHVRRHMIMVHNRSPEHACTLCGAIYSSIKDLCVHFQKVHNVSEDLLDDISPDGDLQAEASPEAGDKSGLDRAGAAATPPLHTNGFEAELKMSRQEQMPVM